MAYISGLDRNQVQMITASLDVFVAQDNPVRVIDAYVNSLDLRQYRTIGAKDSAKAAVSTQRCCLSYIIPHSGKKWETISQKLGHTP